MNNALSFRSSEEGSAQVFELNGYIGNRALAQASRQDLTLFINGRLVQSRPLQTALEAGYGGVLPKGKHPLLVLRIDLPAEELDANVHPAKTEVKQAREAGVAAAAAKTRHPVMDVSAGVPR